jgi:hypothetical protein
MLYLAEEQVRRHLRMEDLIPAMEKALIDFSTGKVIQPLRSGIEINPPGSFFFMMPAFFRRPRRQDRDLLSCKRGARNSDAYGNDLPGGS